MAEQKNSKSLLKTELIELLKDKIKKPKLVTST